jgi:hypothetical protein
MMVLLVGLNDIYTSANNPYFCVGIRGKQLPCTANVYLVNKFLIPFWGAKIHF